MKVALGVFRCPPEALSHTVLNDLLSGKSRVRCYFADIFRTPVAYERAVSAMELAA
jgi:hypothetical protein